ncbi:transcription termination factor 2-like [Drosophila busckii]|uniref:transcription termination factor 2-like n=1 Tax=Drosophila busckii TaxID=30019 RepID=UPI00083EF0E2|nr:transcription termination factor 2-like [Drosophila busckii]
MNDEVKREHVQKSDSEEDKGKKEIRSALKALFEPDVQPFLDSDYAEHVEGLNVPLHDHQEKGLRWLRWRESQAMRGGILGDDMGLGKTMLMIALILFDKETRENQLREAKRKCTSETGGTLVICPLSVISQWFIEATTKVANNGIKTLIYHGPKRRKGTLTELLDYDLVITTYGIVVSEWKDYDENQKNSWLFNTEWKRLILDEAHNIRNPKTLRFKAASNIDACYRWAVTGTPIQNSPMDGFALLKFLRVPHYINVNVWKEILEHSYGPKLMKLIFQKHMLRRTKNQLTDLGLSHLPPMKVELHKVKLSTQEKQIMQIIDAIYHKTRFELWSNENMPKDENAKSAKKKKHIKDDYFTVLTNMQQAISKLEDKAEFIKLYEVYIKSRSINENDRLIKNKDLLVLMTRRQQFCSHPYLMVMPDDAEHPQDLGRSLKEACAEPEIFELEVPSAKLDKVYSLLDRLLKNTSDKIIVVSQWTKFLSIVKLYLEQMHLEILQYNGKMKTNERDQTLKEFKDNPNKRILLLSIKAGGVGLNLTTANHMLLLDPHWNPQLEHQAIDRIHREGQTKNTHIYRFTCSESIDNHIKVVQNNKMQIADQILNDDDEYPSLDKLMELLTI